jgi:hypothetical protein
MSLKISNDTIGNRTRDLPTPPRQFIFSQSPSPAALPTGNIAIEPFFYISQKAHVLCVITGFRRGVNEIFILLGC